MEKYESDNTFIARWVAGELSEEELSEFKKSEAYKEFALINEEAQKFKAPPVDKRQALIKTKEQITFGKKRKPISIYRTWYVVAASIAIIISIFGVLNTTKSYTTSYGEQLAVTLPDGSKIQLNADSKLTHKRFFWLNNRNVSLQGEGYFEVEKGEGFKVETAHGTVAVLGTKFNIKTRSTTFELNCFEGVVRFDKLTSTESKILKKDDRIILSDGIINSEKASETIPNWMQGISIFKEKPLQEVLDEIQIQFNVTFNIKNTEDVSKLFTGSFLHDDLEKALKSTLIPMGIPYKLSEDKSVVYLQ
ncbi:FecR family protein [Aquimarina sp. 2201CG5-10]|uniref:FecR family protein n=1 Tax=Aquimarina callyspongiae TaxID=3098150 RepID=UPI002AB4B4BB|nr:FecR family protein [Aquimarina sp. 2201CG5-10]MDY8134893.1 FecR family protein [Aquimarina sp. 2201CG5-10]